MRLLVEHRINTGVSLLRRGHGVGLMREKIFRGGKSLRKSRVGRGQMANHQCLMHLCAARKHRRDERDAEAAAKVAHEIVKAAGVSDLPLVELAHCGGGERNENKTDGDAV